MLSNKELPIEPVALPAHPQEAVLRDHKVIGQETGLYMTSPDVGPGLIMLPPKGAMLRYQLEQFGQKAHLLNGYQWVYTPHIGRAALWQTSGHLDFYQDAMYRPIQIDNEAYYLKPMNCPFHIMIYNDTVRSYRELPIRYAEYGTVYRYELSGVLNGLARVRGFSQDDAHIICTPEQIQDEVSRALQFSLYILRSFGLEDFEAYIATRPENKSIGTEQDWEKAITVLENAVKSAGLPWQTDAGGGAFYGPKIDLKIKDSLQREWQCSTIQFDFNLPQRFGMHYIDNSGQRQTPLMVHRALFGSLERFMALLIEHYNGDFPFWLAPVQIGIVPVRQDHLAYATKTARQLKQLNCRVDLLKQDLHLRNRIKHYEMEKVPYLLIVGDKEAESESVSVRSRREGQLGTMRLEQFIGHLSDQIRQGEPQCLFD